MCRWSDVSIVVQRGGEALPSPVMAATGATGTTGMTGTIGATGPAIRVEGPLGIGLSVQGGDRGS